MGRDDRVNVQISGIHIHIDIAVPRQSPHTRAANEQVAGFHNLNVSARGIVRIQCDNCRFQSIAITDPSDRRKCGNIGCDI